MLEDPDEPADDQLIYIEWRPFEHAYGTDRFLEVTYIDLDQLAFPTSDIIPYYTECRMV